MFFLFAMTLEDPENCGLVLEMLLERSIEKVVVQTERSLLFSTETRYVRLDVYASDETGVSYNVEMQNENEGNLPKRARYHQAELHSRVKAIKQSRKLEERYMQFEEMLNKRESIGEIKGLEKGEKLKVIDQIVKKVAKGQSPEVIADHLEENISFVQKVCETMQEHPDAAPAELLGFLSQD